MINKAFLLLAMCATATATAAPLPPMPSIPVVKRPKPLISPAHAAAPKSKPMVKATTLASVSEPYQPPPVPMTMTMVKVSSQYGAYQFSAGALQPPNNALSFEYSPVPSDWQPLAYFGPVPYEQTSTASAYSFSDTINVRARLIPIDPIPGQSQTGWMPASLVPVVGTKAYVNPNVPGGVQTWSVRK